MRLCVTFLAVATLILFMGAESSNNTMGREGQIFIYEHIQLLQYHLALVAQEKPSSSLMCEIHYEPNYNVLHLWCSLLVCQRPQNKSSTNNRHCPSRSSSLSRFNKAHVKRYASMWCSIFFTYNTYLVSASSQSKQEAEPMSLVACQGKVGTYFNSSQTQTPTHTTPS